MSDTHHGWNKKGQHQFAATTLKAEPPQEKREARIVILQQFGNIPYLRLKEGHRQWAYAVVVIDKDRRMNVFVDKSWPACETFLLKHKLYADRIDLVASQERLGWWARRNNYVVTHIEMDDETRPMSVPAEENRPVEKKKRPLPPTDADMKPADPDGPPTYHFRPTKAELANVVAKRMRVVQRGQELMGGISRLSFDLGAPGNHVRYRDDA